MKHITRIHRMEPMIQKSNLLNIDRQHIFLHTLYSIEPGLYSSFYSPLLLWSLATYSRIKASSSRSRLSSKLLRMVCLYSEVVLDFRFGHWKCPNREWGKGHFHLLNFLDQVKKSCEFLERMGCFTARIEVMNCPLKPALQSSCPFWLRSGTSIFHICNLYLALV